MQPVGIIFHLAQSSFAKAIIKFYRHCHTKPMPLCVTYFNSDESPILALVLSRFTLKYYCFYPHDYSGKCNKVDCLYVKG